MKGRSWAWVLNLERKSTPEDHGGGAWLAGGQKGCWDRLDLGSLTAKLLADSALASFLACLIASIFSRLLSIKAHCKRKASRNQEKAPQL